MESVPMGIQQIFDAEEHPHRRFNPLLNEWVLVSPQRTKRPWQGQEEKLIAPRTSFDSSCYLCPGNVRANGESNPPYEKCFVFNNDFAALLPDGVGTTLDDSFGIHDELYQIEPVTGECRVFCFHPRHDLTLARLTKEQIADVVLLWCEQASELNQKYEWVQIFENKGEVMGCSNPHPHGQIWASNYVPTLLQKEDVSQSDFFARTGKNMIQTIVSRELSESKRVVAMNDSWVAFVPFWAVWPFEVMIAPTRQVSRMSDLAGVQMTDLASLLKEVTVRFDNLFRTDFPYSFGWHWAPKSASQPESWCLHAHFYPPLLRSASVKKFQVGYEMLGEAQRDLTPEKAAQMLRDQSVVHFSDV